MARDYKSYSTHSKKAKSSANHTPFVIAVVAIVAILLLIMGYHKIAQRKLAKQNAVLAATETKSTRKENNSKNNTTTTTDQNTTDTTENQSPEIKFEFYNILPNEKVADNVATSATAAISPEQTQTVNKPTSEAAAAKATERDNTTAAATDMPKATAPATSTAKPATIKPTVSVPTKQSMAAMVPPANGYNIQVVSVRNQKDAETISAKLKNDGFAVQTIKINANGTEWYRIQVGPFKTMDDALSAQMTLRKNNYHAILLKPKT